MKATKRAKTAKKAMHKGKSLEAVKPLTKIAGGGNELPKETVTFEYGGLQVRYSQQ
ncbi:MAG TPA: hypothetical protein VGD60_05050 [Candidatus Acidoferrales bacterium]